ncbi:hypothetical protein BKA65DRAFT_537407 [Rhexocercosporidium sp. MPI-PUGE-AT-0058]|nr:hypothetical protein BKA65DRAFT_537407 [Rhexocercosporidium sp. MPI-PUGE-AT-0058]
MTNSLLAVKSSTNEMAHAPLDIAQSSGPSKSQWEYRRQQITRLYRDENMKLREVMAIMRDQGFIATERMYKDRMKKWGVTKNIKEHEAVAVLQIKSGRDAEGKKTLIGKNEQVMELERFIRHAKRKGLQIEGQPPASIPSYISCRTPPPEERLISAEESGDIHVDSEGPYLEVRPSSISLVYTPQSGSDSDEIGEDPGTEFSRGRELLSHSRQLRLTQGTIQSPNSRHSSICQSPSLLRAFSVPEQLLHGIKCYFDSSFEQGVWVVDTNGYCIVSTGCGGNIDPDRKNKLLGYCCLAADLKRKNLLVELRRVLSKTFHLAEEILRSAYPRTLDRIFEALLYLSRNGLPEVAMLLRDYIRGVASTFFPINHPWTHVCQLIGMLSQGTLEQAIEQSWRCAKDSTEENLGVSSDFSLLCGLQFDNVVIGSVDPLAEEKRLRSLLATYDAIPDCRALTRSRISLQLCNCLLKQKRYSEAEMLGLDLLLQIRESDLQISVGLQIDVLVAVATSQYLQDKRHDAEGNIRAVIFAVTDYWGGVDSAVWEYLSAFESWLRVWGRQEEADTLRTEIVGLITWSDLNVSQDNSLTPLLTTREPQRFRKSRVFVRGRSGRSWHVELAGNSAVILN